MGDLKSRLAPLFRRSSTAASTRSSASTSSNAFDSKQNRSRTSLLSKTRKSSLGATTVYEETEAPQLPALPLAPGNQVTRNAAEQTPDTSLETQRSTPLKKRGNPVLSVQAPTPDLLTATSGPDAAEQPTSEQEPLLKAATGGKVAPAEGEQDQLPARGEKSSQVGIQLAPDKLKPSRTETGYFDEPNTSAKMAYRKIWVKRAGASATLVQITEDDLVDDVRDRILKKYGNSLGRSFDAPDVTLRVIPKDQLHPIRHPPPERTLGPEEPMAGVLDSYYPGGQTVDNALIIDVPRRTPRHSPRPAPYYVEDSRPMESGSDYFPTMPAGQPSPQLPATLPLTTGHAQPPHHLPPHSMAIINTGYVPPLPSPGARTRHSHRPRIGRTHTTSPTVLTGAAASQGHGKMPLCLLFTLVLIFLLRVPETASQWCPGSSANTHTSTANRCPSPNCYPSTSSLLPTTESYS